MTEARPTAAAPVAKYSHCVYNLGGFVEAMPPPVEDSGNDGAEVVLVVEGGGHTWPGQEPLLRFLGKPTKNISANDLMWEFFVKHPMK